MTRNGVPDRDVMVVFSDGTAPGHAGMYDAFVGARRFGR